MVQIEKQSARIHDLVYQDEITGLLNRFGIYEYLEGLLKSTTANVAVLFIDVDNFKFINDTYGHELGDKVIVATAQVLNAFSDLLTFARFGGDEFIGVYENYDSIDQVKELSMKVKNQFSNPIIVDQKKFYLTISIGISCYPENATEHKALIKKSDLALYAAKESGKNCILIYDQSMEHELEVELEFQNALIEAHKQGNFYLNYQPYYEIETGKIVGFEALIRWKSDAYGQVNPYKLITHAESMGLIIEIGEWVFRTACKFCKKANDVSSSPIKVAINISIIQLLAHDFYDLILKIVSEEGVKPSNIVLEMTETILIESVEHSVTILEKFRAAGFGIALDDFGTGYSSLSYLKSLPVSVLKIDREFVTGIIESGFDSEVVDMIVRLANYRGMTTIAEGVETKEQYDLLKEKKCDIIQGYYLSKPLEEDVALEQIQ